MAREVRADVGILAKASTDISTTSEALNQSVKKLESAIAELMGLWVSPAASAFGGVANEWAIQNKKHQDELMRISTAVKDTSVAFDQQEQHAQAAAQAIGANLA